MADLSTLFLRLFVAIIIGGLIGAEREYASKSAGLRTVILISLGSCIFTIFSLYIGQGSSPDRIASNIVTGIGFLGAGVIFKADKQVKGLTTAATVWAAAALGMGAGGGYYWVSIGGAIMVLITLNLLTYLEQEIEKSNQTRSYRIKCSYEQETLKRFEEMFNECGLHFKREKQSRIAGDISGIWAVSGSEKNHDKLINKILRDDTVAEFDF